MATTEDLFRVQTVTRKMYDEKTLGGRVMKAAEDYAARQITDPFAGIYNVLGAQSGGDLGILEPPFPPDALMRLPSQNNTLGQCIEAMKTNIEGFGYTLEYIGPPKERESAEVKAEFQRMNDLCQQPNGEDTLRTIRERMRVDYETLGYASIEVGRDGTGDVIWLVHIPSHSIRRTKTDAEFTDVKMFLRRGGADYEEVTIKRRFCRFVQKAGEKKIYFKELGDPRRISANTGQPFQEGKQPTPDEPEATEILWLSRYVSGEVYGLPRWINQLPSVLGTREAELTNLQFFQDNGIPALAILVAGGLLSVETMQQIEEKFSVRGRDAVNRVVVIEARSAQSAENPLSELGTSQVPKLELKPLAGERQDDALFQEYDKNGQTKIRSSFRIPPLFIGLAEDYTKASAVASLETADSQVFSPERLRFDDIMNSQVLLHDGKPPQFWRFRTNPAKIVSSEGVVRAMESINKVGGMTPNVAIQMANELLDLHIPKFDKDWGDIPFDFTKGLITSGRLVPEGAQSAGQITDPTKGPVKDNKLKSKKPPVGKSK